MYKIIGGATTLHTHRLIAPAHAYLATSIRTFLQACITM